jgi:hypothetical protein
MNKMSKKLFTPLNNLPNIKDLENMISNFEYKKVEINQLPEPIKNNGLVTKCNSFILCASGTTNGMLYSFVGIRPDKGDVIDEHPFVFYYDINPSNNFGGIIHHGDWDGRTTSMEQWQIDALDASGLTASFTYKTIPPLSSGSLDDLRNNGMIKGLSKQFEILFKNKPKEQ